MSLHQRRRRTRVHWADIATAMLVAASLAPLLWWLGGIGLWEWEPAAGEVTAVAFHRYASNHDRFPDEAVVQYRYHVHGAPHTGQWQGAWPTNYSPDAIARADQERLLRPGRSLTVYHDPFRPQRNTLHTPRPEQSPLLPIASCIAFPATLAALRRFYPRFRPR